MVDCSLLVLCLTVARLDDTRRSEGSSSYLPFDKGEEVSRKVSEVKGR